MKKKERKAFVLRLRSFQARFDVDLNVGRLGFHIPPELKDRLFSRSVLRSIPLLQSAIYPVRREVAKVGQGRPGPRAQEPSPVQL